MPTNSINLFVGNLSWDATEDDLRAFLEGFGAISSCKIMTDRETGKPRGFGFVEFADRTQGEAAMRGVNGREFMGRLLNMEEARPKAQGGREGFHDRGNNGGRR